jgi:hypothetical protein
LKSTPWPRGQPKKEITLEKGAWHLDISLLLYLSCLFIIGGFGEVMTMCRKKIIFTAGLAAAILLVTPFGARRCGDGYPNGTSRQA